MHAEPARVGKQLEHAFCARADTLPEPTRRALVVAATANTSDLGDLRTALARLELALDALEPAEAAGLVSLEAAALTFRHPLVRSALFHGSDPAERRRAHAALAAALADEDRGAWHLAAAAVGPDSRAADALERVADTATRRSGYAAAAAAYERAARLSERPQDRLRRLSAAADSAWLAGRTAHALALIEEALAHAEMTPAAENCCICAGQSSTLPATPRGPLRRSRRLPLSSSIRIASCLPLVDPSQRVAACCRRGDACRRTERTPA